MKPDIQGNIAIFTPKGMIDSENALSFITPADITYVSEQLQINLVLISLKQLFDYNPGGMTILIQALRKIGAETGIEIGFCDYGSVEKYKKILKLVSSVADIYLFSSLHAAEMLRGERRSKKGGKVLVYDHRPESTEQVVMALHRLGFETETEQNFSAFQNRQFDRKTFSDAIGPTRLGNISDKIVRHKQGQFIIYTLTPLLDSSMVEQFAYDYHNKLLEIGYRFFILDGSVIRSMNVHGVRFVSQLAREAAAYGAGIFMTGLNQVMREHPLLEEIKSSGIVIYEDVADVLYDGNMLHDLFLFEGSTWMQKREKKTLPKEIVGNMKNIIKICADSLSTSTNQTVTYKKAHFGRLDFSPEESSFRACSIGFMHALDFELYMCIHESAANEASRFLLGKKEDEESENTEVMEEILFTLGHRLRSQFLNQGYRVEMSMPKSFPTQMETTTTTKHKKGIVVDIEINNQPSYIMVN